MSGSIAYCVLNVFLNVNIDVQRKTRRERDDVRDR